MHSAETYAMESALAAHPAVRAAAVLDDIVGEHSRWVAYIVPDEGYLSSSFPLSDEARQTDRWRKVYDLYQKPKTTELIDTGLRSQVWTSAYTKQPIPEREMQEWIAKTLNRVRQLNPKRVLEVGCGLGALLLPLAPNCELYVGTDISGASIASLGRHIAASPEKWTSVQLFERAADQLSDFEDGFFDTVIINSVTMYFPSAEYLSKVLANAVRVIRAGGTIFVGDVRSLPLLKIFAVSVELFRADVALSLDELRDRVRKRIKFETELFISPLFFLAVRKLCPQISHVEVWPKQGTFDNEMNRFRYDVVLRVGPVKAEPIEPQWVDGRNYEIPAIERILRRERPEIVGFTGVRNFRTEKDIRAAEMLSDRGGSGSVGDLKKALNNAPSFGIHPNSLSVLADQAGYQVELSWANARLDGSYDAVFCRRDHLNQNGLSNIEWPCVGSLDEPLSRYVAGALQRDRFSKLTKDLRDFLMERFEPHLVPSEILLVGQLPSKQPAERPLSWFLSL